ncbi:MAG: DUF3108 domain-containing protein [Deltaproteobacteria bacterium]|nr:MAG: DUF3108 domain-containing protein [Deltaproteobacteria bacterium]
MNQTLLILIAFVIAGCSSSVKTMFEEKEETYEIAENLEINQSIAEKFKTQEPVKTTPSKKKKKVAKKRKPKKIKKEMIPKEFRAKLLALDEKSKPIWDLHKPIFKTEEEIVIKIYFFGLTVGHLKMSIEPMVKIGERPAYHFQARMKSAKYYSYFYALDNTIDSYLDFKTLKPLKYSGIQRESKQSIDELQFFDMEKRKTFAWYKRIKKDKNKEFKREAYTPEFFMDLYSTFYFTRGLPMVKGNQYTIPVVSRAKIYMFHMEVMGEEKVKVNRRSYLGYKIKASSISDDGKKKGEVFFWYSSEPSRKLLKFTAKVKIGTIKGELVDYKRGPELSSLNVVHERL